MRRQRNIFQMKEQDQTFEEQLNKVEISLHLLRLIHILAMALLFKIVIRHMVLYWVLKMLNFLERH